MGTSRRRSWRTAIGSTRIEATLRQPAATAPSRKAALLSWAANFVRTPRNIRESGFALGIITGWIDLITGKFRVMDGVTGFLVTAGRLLMQAPM